MRNSMPQELFYRIALTMIPNVGNVYARMLAEHFGSASAVFKAKAKELGLIEGIGKKRIDSILRFDFEGVEKEMEFIEKHQIKALFFQDADYPQRLLHCYDAPVMLYFKGNTDLNSPKIIGIVGTRNQSEYGKSMCENIVGGLHEAEDVQVIS